MRNGGSDLNGGARADRLPNRAAPFTTTVSSGEVVVDGPTGFCIDRSATKDVDLNSFVLLGNCASLSNARINESSNTKAMLTASLSQSADGEAARLDGTALSSFFKSDAGRNSLAREHTDGVVSVNETFFQDDVFYIYPSDGGSTARDLDTSYWRAILVIKGRLTSLTVQDFASKKMSDANGLDLLQEFVAVMRAANGGDPAPLKAPVAVAAKPKFVAPKSNRRLVGVGLLRRILQ